MQRRLYMKNQLKLLENKYRKIFVYVTCVAIFTQINWALRHDFNDIAVRIAIAIPAGGIFTIIVMLIVKVFNKDKKFLGNVQIKPFIFYSLVFLFFYFYLASKYHFAGVNTDLMIFASVFLLLIQFIGGLFFFRIRNRISSWLLCLTSFLLCFILIVQLLVLWVFVGDESINFTLLNANISIANNQLADFFYLGIVFSLLTIPFYHKQNSSPQKAVRQTNWLILSLSALYLTGFIFLWAPMSVYSTFPEAFEFAAFNIIKNNYVLFLISYIMIHVIYLVLPKTSKRIFTVFVLALLVVSIFHNTILPIDVGTLQENKYVKDNNLAAPLLYYLLESVLILSIVIGVQWVLKKKYFKQVSVALILLNLIVISQSVIVSSKTGCFWKKSQIPLDMPSSIAFSREKKNIIFFITDMFQGWYMNDILEHNPELEKDLEGFVWYPNTLSMSNLTSTSIPSILGGFSYTPDKMNKDTARTVSAKITDVTEKFRDRIKANGYHFTSTSMIYSTIDKSTFDTYLPKWHMDWNHWNSLLNIGFSREIGYTILWENAAFYSAPLFLKPIIYNRGKWFHENLKANENTNNAKHYNFLRLLPFISKITTDKPNFVYIHSMASHHPWDYIDDNGVMHHDVPPFENNKWVIKTLIQWFNWMKKNDVYDNTKIIILSDHGPHWLHYKEKMDISIPFVANPNLDISKGEALSMNALLLVKDFYSTGKIAVDNRFMSNADASSIAFEEGNQTTIEASPKRVLTAWGAGWVNRIEKKKQFVLGHGFRVENNYFNFNNWTRIQENK